MSNSMTGRRVAVIGAGPCGLPACKALGELGIEYECLEAADDIGGIWNVERGPGGGYRSLQTNTSISAMRYSDFPFADGAPTYPSAAEMVRYFRSYAEAFDLVSKIRFGRRVERATPIEGGGWRIEVAGGETRDYAALVVSSGQYTRPRRPHESIPGDFSGEAIHVFDYLDAADPVDCRGKRVVVVGLGSSGAEIASELCDARSPVGCASQVTLSARSGRWVLPKVIDGEPLDANSLHPSVRPPEAVRALPGEEGAWAVRKVLGAVLRSHSSRHGGAAALGLPEPEIEPWEERPTMSIDFIPALQAGRIEVRPGIRRFEGSTVHFDDGSRTDADVIIYGTGYQLDFPFLEATTLGCKAPDLALYQRIAHPMYDDLFFLGCCRVMCSMWPLAEQQAYWVARLLKGVFELPSRDERMIEAVQLASSLPVMCNFYIESLRKQAGGLQESSS